MNMTRRAGKASVLAAALALTMTGTAQSADTVITLIQLQDVHGNIAPHPGIIHNLDGTETEVLSGGGLAKTKTLINQIRADNPNNLLLAVGDTIHGTAEVLFTVGDAIMPTLNSFGIDAYTPGNWEFGYGPAVFRNRFTPPGTAPGGTPAPGALPYPSPKPGLPANIQVMAGAVDCSDVPVIAGVTDVPGFCVEMPPSPSAHRVIKANFPTIALNVYNDTDTAPLPGILHHKPIMPGYKMFNVDGVNVAVIGITASIVPQQASVFNIGLRFTQGVAELPGVIDTVKDLGANVIVVQSELGLSQNLAIARQFEDIDVMLSAHTHETTLSALVASEDEVEQKAPNKAHRLKKGRTVVVETTEDMYLGRLDLTIKDGKVKKFVWEAIPVDDSVAEDPTTKILVDAAIAPFYGVTTERHTFMPGGFCAPGAVPDQTTLDAKCGDTTTRGLQLTESLDTVVGFTDVELHRDNVLEDEINNFIADAVFSTTNTIMGGGVDLSMTNGFRFGNPILPGAITLGDLYTQFPISPAVAVAEFSGEVILNDLERVLTAVFDRNPFLQRGGWYVGLANMTQKIDLDNRPYSSSDRRIIETMIGGVKLDPSARYTFASCFPHGDAVDRICRTNGGNNHQFFQLADPDEYNSAITLVPPVNDIGIISGPIIKQIAPDTYAHPVHLLRRYLDSLPDNTITAAEASTGRIQTVDSTRFGNPPVPAPVSAIDPTLIQPPEGAGPLFFGGISGIGDND